MITMNYLSTEDSMYPDPGDFYGRLILGISNNLDEHSVRKEIVERVSPFRGIDRDFRYDILAQLFNRNYFMAHKPNLRLFFLIGSRLWLIEGLLAGLTEEFVKPPEWEPIDGSA